MEEIERPVLVMLDKSGSMSLGFGSSKLDQAIFASAALATLVIKDKNKIAFASFSDNVGEFIEFGKNKKHLYKIFSALVNTKPMGNTNIEESVHQILPRIPSRSLIIIITDMSDDPESMKKAFKLMNYYNHKVIIIHIYDPFMFKLPIGVDIMTFKDSKGNKLKINIKDQKFKETYDTFVKMEEMKRIDFITKCREAGVDIFSIKTTEIVENALIKYLISKKRGFLFK